MCQQNLHLLSIFAEVGIKGFISWKLWKGIPAKFERVAVYHSSIYISIPQWVQVVGVSQVAGPNNSFTIIFYTCVCEFLFFFSLLVSAYPIRFAVIFYGSWKKMKSLYTVFIQFQERVEISFFHTGYSNIINSDPKRLQKLI